MAHSLYGILCKGRFGQLFACTLNAFFGIGLVIGEGCRGVVVSTRTLYCGDFRGVVKVLVRGHYGHCSIGNVLTIKVFIIDVFGLFFIWGSRCVYLSFFRGCAVLRTCYRLIVALAWCGFSRQVSALVCLRFCWGGIEVGSRIVQNKEFHAVRAPVMLAKRSQRVRRDYAPTRWP